VSAPWWTDADQAEADTIAWLLADLLPQHWQECLWCEHAPVTGLYNCPQVLAVFQAVEDWRTGRDLLSRAEFLRELRKRGVYEA
jgi:hypothetical protein